MIFHGRFKRMLPQFIYGDLAPDDEARLRRHLELCQSCAADCEELRLLSGLVAGAGRRDVDEKSLEEARLQLIARLPRPVRTRRSSMAGIFAATFRPWRPGIALAGMVCALVVGVLLGGQLFHADGGRETGFASPDGRAGMQVSDLEGMSVSNLRILGGSETDGEIAVAFDATRTVRLRGTLADPLVQRVIARAIVDGENAGVRMRAASHAMPVTAEPGDREIKAALLLAMKNDPNDGVRKAALEALLRYPADLEIRDGLVQVLLADENLGLRVAAINGLGTMSALGLASDARLRGSLEAQTRREDNLFVKTRMESLLKGRIQ